MLKKKCIVTVINSISETSMPYNEFVKNRFKNSKNDKHIVIVCNKPITSSTMIPKGLDVYYVGNNLIKLLKRMKMIKKVCIEHGMKLIIHLHQPRSAAFFLLSTFFKSYRKKSVFTIHSMYNAYRPITKFLSIISTLLVSQVTCVSESSLNSYPVYIRKYKKDKMIVLRNGVDLNRIEKFKKNISDTDNRVKILIYVARMIPTKNHKFLINVVSKLKNCKLVLIGEEDKNGEIKNLIKTKNLTEKIEIVGLIPREEVYRRLQNADIYVSPSSVEGLPISVLEAMYIGLPVILSDIPAHREIASHEENVVTIALKEEVWIQRLTNYIDMSKDQLSRIGDTCRLCASENFSLEKMHMQFNELYEKI